MIIVGGVLTIPASAYDFQVEGLCYNRLSDNEVEVTYINNKGGSYSGTLIIPEKVTNNGVSYNVTTIGKSAFYKCTGLTGTLNIPNSIKIIKESAFYGCSGFNGSLIIPNSVITIEENAFAFCSGITGSLTIGNAVSYIGDTAFWECNFTGSLVIPNSVKEIGRQAFENCSGFTGDITIGTSVSIINSSAFSGCRGISTLYILPDYMRGIYSSAFYNCKKLSKVVSKLTEFFELRGGVFEGISSSAILHVPKGTRDSYINYGWMPYFYDIVEDPNIFEFGISVNGNGSVLYNGSTIRNESKKYDIEEGKSITLSFSPDNGYRIKSVIVNGSDVTSQVTNNSFTISNIRKDTSAKIIFEAIPVTTYTLSIKATGNGSASYDGNTIRGKTSSFTVNEGTSVTITFNPDNGYRIKSVKEDGTDVTSYVSNGTYSISVISKNTSIEVEFEAIPATTYTLSITSSGNGSASYDGTTIRSKTSTFTVNEGTNATISFSADNGYRIKNVKVNSTNVTSNVSNNQYTVINIQSNTTLEVEFEAIPPTTYTLSIKATGSGSASYDGTTIRSKTSTFTVNEGTNATISFSADNGYRIKSVKVNSTDVTSSVSNNKYTISNIQRNTTVEVEFEAIPATTYTLSIKSTGSGYASYSGTTVRATTKNFTVNEGASATISFNPDNGYRVKSVKVNSSDVTSNLSNNKYTISNINKNTNVEVEFQEELKTFTSGNLNYAVLSYDDKTVSLANGKYGTVLEVPATVTYQDITWKVAGIDNAALANNEELAAIIWNPSAAFTVSVSNPNLLLYVKSSNYAPATIQNVVVNSTAESIVLTDAASGNIFYCPKEFTAKKISYTHNYGMITGLGESRGWETIALPFDVKKITHSSKGELTPFANWRSGDSKKPFWLMSYGASGWANASSIKANTPYIISMPNNPDYKAEFRLSGNITFSAENVTVKKSDNLQTGNYGGNTFTPNFFNTDNSGYLALNVNNDYVSYSGGSAEGSTFVVNLRPVHPFEAYMISKSKTRSTISINGDMATGIEDISVLMDESKGLRIYNLKGQLIKVEQDKSLDEVRRSLPAGVYIVNGKKLIIK